MLLGSLLLLAALIYMYTVTGTTDAVKLQQYPFTAEVRTWPWLAFFVSVLGQAADAARFDNLAVPDAHVERLDGRLGRSGRQLPLKMGASGFRCFQPRRMFLDASLLFQPPMPAPRKPLARSSIASAGRRSTLRSTSKKR